MKRIAIGQVLQETNLLNPVETRREDFADYGLAQGDEVVARYGGRLTSIIAAPYLVVADSFCGLYWINVRTVQPACSMFATLGGIIMEAN